MRNQLSSASSLPLAILVGICIELAAFSVLSRVAWAEGVPEQQGSAEGATAPPPTAGVRSAEAQSGRQKTGGVTERAVAPPIELPKAVHFQTPSGDDVVVGPGSYKVEATGQGLRLTPMGGQPDDTKIIRAKPLPAPERPEAEAYHPETPIEVPEVLSQEIGDDARLIALLRSDGTGLEAVGSYSGVRSRGGCAEASPCYRAEYTTPPGSGGFPGLPSGGYVSGVMVFSVDPGKHRNFDAFQNSSPFDVNPYAIKKVRIAINHGSSVLLCEKTSPPYKCSVDTTREEYRSFEGRTSALTAWIYDRANQVYHIKTYIRFRNYKFTVVAGDGALWGLIAMELNIPGTYGIFRNHYPVPGSAYALKVVRGQVQVRLNINGQWWAWNGTTWVQPVLEPIPRPTQPPTAPPTVVQPPPPTPPPGQPLITASFTSSADGFVYQDDAFRGTAQPTYANGTYLATGGFSGGGLQVELGGLDANPITNMSGGWTRTFTLAAPATLTLSFRYNLTQNENYEPDEASQVLVSLDGRLLGTAPNDYVAQVVGDGNGGAPTTTGWQLVTLTIPNVAAGQHQLRLGGYNNKKTAADETTTVRLDDVLLQ